MGRDKTWGSSSAAIAAFSLIIGIIGTDGIMIALSGLVLCFSILSLAHHPEIFLYSFLMSVTIFVCSFMMTTITSYEYLVEGGLLSRYHWIYVSAIIHTSGILPIIFVFYLLTAKMFNASYNWVIVAGLGCFIGLGFIVPGYVLMFLIQRADIDAGIITNANIVIGLMVSLIIFVSFALTLRYIFKKKRCVITASGLESIL